MKGNPVLYKSLVIGVIALFIGVGVQPAIATIQQNNSEIESYDVNIEICGLGKEYTIQLTKQQLKEIEALFESIRDELDKVKTKEETVGIYNDAIVDLDSYGLLDDYSVIQIQKLITGNYLKDRNSHLLNKLENNQLLDMNAFCLISGDTDNTYFIPPLAMLFHRISLVLFLEVNIFTALALIRMLFGTPIPIKFGSGIAFGYYETMGYRYYPANGWIHTQGSFGDNYWNDDIFGQISEFLLLLYPHSVFVGVTGFVGIKISKEIFGSDGYYYLGFANYVNLGSKHI